VKVGWGSISWKGQKGVNGGGGVISQKDEGEVMKTKKVPKVNRWKKIFRGVMQGERGGGEKSSQEGWGEVKGRGKRESGHILIRGLKGQKGKGEWGWLKEE